MPKPRINIAAINAVLRNRRSSDDAKSRKAALSGQDGASGGLPSVRTNYFGDFARSLFTLFQILTGDNWGNLARTLFFTYNTDEEFNGAFVAFVAFYFVSYVVLSSWVLINVVVAVLLDKFIETDAEEQLLQQAQEAAAAKVEAGAQDGGAPLPDGIELTTTPAAPPLTSAEAMEARLARLEEQQLRILSLLEAKLK